MLHLTKFSPFSNYEVRHIESSRFTLTEVRSPAILDLQFVSQKHAAPGEGAPPSNALHIKPGKAKILQKGEIYGFQVNVRNHVQPA